MNMAGLIGAVIGFALGLLEYRLMSAVVIGALRRTDRSQTAAEKVDIGAGKSVGSGEDGSRDDARAEHHW